MRKRPLTHLDDYLESGGGPDDNGGVWQLGELRITASWEEGWERVSVAHPGRTPTWQEMENARALFFKQEDIVVQHHPRQHERVLLHKHTLHLWRAVHQSVPRPPAWMLGDARKAPPPRIMRKLIADHDNSHRIVRLDAGAAVRAARQSKEADGDRANE